MSAAGAILWARPDQGPPLRSALDHAGITVLGAGCPDTTRSSQLSKDLNTEPITDLRHALATMEPDLVLFADPGTFADDDIEQDLTTLQSLHAREIAVATIEPIPARATLLTGTRWAEALQSGAFAQFIHQVPLIRHSRLMVETVSALETMGPVRSMSFSLLAPSALGSLGARIFDAMDLIRTIMGVPELIDASYTSANVGSALHQLPGQSMRGLAGVLSAHLRMPDARGATIHCSDQAGRTTTTANFVTTQGTLTLNDEGFIRHDPSGSEIDRYEPKPDPETDPTTRRLTHQLIQICSGITTPSAPVDHASVLAMCHASMLSARTGQAETPETIRRLLLEV